MMERDSFVFYSSFLHAIDECPVENQRNIYRAIAAYALLDEESELSGVEKAIFTMAKPLIDANNKRRGGGCKGGAPRGNSNARKTTKNNQKQPMVDFENNLKQPMVDFFSQKKQPNENENEHENENGNENEEREKQRAATQKANDFLEQFFSPVNQGNLQIFVEQLHRLNSDIAFISDLRPYVDEVMARWGISNKQHYDYTDWASHMLDSIRKIAADRATRKKDEPTKNGLDLYAEQQRRLLNEQLARNGTDVCPGNG